MDKCAHLRAKRDSNLIRTLGLGCLTSRPHTLVKQNVRRPRHHLRLSSPSDSRVVEVIPLALLTIAHAAMSGVVPKAEGARMVHHCVELVLSTSLRPWLPQPRIQVQIQRCPHERIHFLDRATELLRTEALQVDEEALGSRPDIQFCDRPLNGPGPRALHPVVLGEFLLAGEGVQALLQVHLHVGSRTCHRRGLRRRWSRGKDLVEVQEIDGKGLRRAELEDTLGHQIIAFIGAEQPDRGHRYLQLACTRPEVLLKTLRRRSQGGHHLGGAGRRPTRARTAPHREHVRSGERRVGRARRGQGGGSRGLPNLCGDEVDLLLGHPRVVRHLEGPDDAHAPQLAQGVCGAPKLQHPLPVDVRERVAGAPIADLLAGEHVEEAILQVGKGAALRDLD
mmetsp:Transcript_59334/g.191822  ORF Transcript_59334/g.191822 Transcript_59334/m.191822 type:complete len:393 (-) Transcript_59334:799-1977(-)